jgi:hypothetical protein
LLHPRPFREGVDALKSSDFGRAAARFARTALDVGLEEDAAFWLL